MNLPHCEEPHQAPLTLATSSLKSPVEGHQRSPPAFSVKSLAYGAILSDSCMVLSKAFMPQADALPFQPPPPLPLPDDLGVVDPLPVELPGTVRRGGGGGGADIFADEKLCSR